MVEVGKLRLKTRLSTAKLRRLKSETDLDFTTQDAKAMLAFSADPLVVAEACYYLYEDQIKAAGVSQDEFEELIGPEETEALREEVIEQMKSFSYFWRILSTEMESLQSGNTSLNDLLDRAVKVKEASGPSS